ncbi:hypothetical protein MOQ_002929, partial [Trypanosoma cruzi marinkellei]
MCVHVGVELRRNVWDISLPLSLDVSGQTPLVIFFGGERRDLFASILLFFF